MTDFASPNSSGIHDLRNFKPMYTLQPVKSTREKQLKQWSEILMRYCKVNRVSSFSPFDFILFSNDLLGRKLAREGIIAIVENMISAGQVYLWSV